MNYSATMRDTPDGVTLRPHGDIDLASYDHLRRDLRTVIRRSTRLIEVDLTEVTFLDAAGIGVLVEAFHAAGRVRRHLTTTHPQPLVRTVLDITGVWSLLTADHRTSDCHCILPLPLLLPLPQAQATPRPLRGATIAAATP